MWELSISVNLKQLKKKKKKGSAPEPNMLGTLLLKITKISYIFFFNSLYRLVVGTGCLPVAWGHYVDKAGLFTGLL